MKPVELVIERLRERDLKATQNGTGWLAQCPAHDDRQASLSIGEGDDGRALLNCHAGCEFSCVVAALDLEEKDLFAENRERGRKKGRPPVAATYDYTDEEGRLLFQVVRREDKTFTQRQRDGDDWTWNIKGVRRVLYRLPRIIEAVKAGETVYIVEGEKDVHAVEKAGAVATCNPLGAGPRKWRPEYTETLRGAARVVVVADKDKPGYEHAKRIYDALQDVAQAVDAAEAAIGKDAADHLAAGRTLDDLAPLGSTAGRRCERLAGKAKLLDAFLKAIRELNVVGEDNVLRLLYLALTSRLLARPVSVAVKGPSSGGKSYLVEAVLRFFPDRAYYSLSAMSEKALAYSEEPLKHRFLVVYEASGLKSEFASYLVRSLLSEGRVRYETVVQEGGKLKPKLIEREGPTGLVVTTTAAALHPENETRMLSVTVTDTQEQTKAILRAQAKDDDEAEPAWLDEWRALQTWLEDGEPGVRIPYLPALAEAIPPCAVRLRRDFPAIKSLVAAHALLHGRSREHVEGRVVATLEDYEAVRELVGDLVAEGIQFAVSKTLRETVKAVGDLRVFTTYDKGVPVSALAKELKIDRSAASRRARDAKNKGYLQNEEDRKGRPARYVLGDPLPTEDAILPDRAVLEDAIEDAAERAAIQDEDTQLRAPRGAERQTK